MSQLAAAVVPAHRPRMRTALIGGFAAIAVLVTPGVGLNNSAALAASPGSAATSSPTSSGSSSSSSTSTLSRARS